MVVLSTVVIILAGSLLVPAINDAADGDAVTYQNNSGVYVEKSPADGTVTISKAADSATVQINSETRTQDSMTRTLLAIPGCSIVLQSSTESYVILVNDTLNNKYVMVTEANSFSVDVSNSTCSYTVDSTTTSVPVVSDFFYYSENGSYAMISPSAGVYSKLSDFVAYTQISRHTYWYTATATYDNTTADSTIVADITKETMPGSEDKMDYITGVKLNDNTAWVSFAPRTTTIHINEMDAGTNAILYAIPVLIIVALLLVAVSTFTRNRD